MQIGNLLTTHLHKWSEHSSNKFTSDPFNFPGIDHAVAVKVGAKPMTVNT